MVGEDDKRGPPFVIWASLWGLGAATFVALIGIDYFLRPGRDVIGRDFVNLWTAGRLVLDGRVADIFDVAAYRQSVAAFFQLSLPLNYSYPPHALFIAVPLALLPYHSALLLWSGVGIAGFLLAATSYIRFSPVLAVMTPAALLCLWFGHYGLVLGALWLAFFRLFGSRRAGLAAAAMTVKPHMGLLIAFAAFRSRRTLMTAVVGTLALGLASVAVFGLQPWLEFFHKTSATQAALLVNGTDGVFYYRMMPSAFVAYGRGPIAIALHTAFACAALWMVARSKPDPFAYAAATFLILPYAFNYDMTVVSLGFAALLNDRWERLSVVERGIAAGGFLAPQLTFFVNFLVPPLLLAGLWLLARNVESTAASSD